jgi:hypothetical protein
MSRQEGPPQAWAAPLPIERLGQPIVPTETILPFWTL